MEKLVDMEVRAVEPRVSRAWDRDTFHIIDRTARNKRRDTYDVARCGARIACSRSFTANLQLSPQRSDLCPRCGTLADFKAALAKARGEG